MEDKERIESPDEDVEGHRRKALTVKQHEDEAKDDESDDEDVEGHIIHRPTTL